MKKILLIITAAGMLLTSCNEGVNQRDITQMNGAIAEAQIKIEKPVFQDSTVVDIVMSNANFAILVKAIQAGGLEETLRGNGPYTVFAPINSAFRELPQGEIDFYKNPENRSKITDLLTYHIVAGEYKAADVLKAIKGSKGEKFETNTIKGEKITIMMDGQNVVVRDAKGGKAVVIKGDITASNGVVHAINAVLMPKE